jgi:hypothetical protein
MPPIDHTVIAALTVSRVPQRSMISPAGMRLAA